LVGTKQIIEKLTGNKKFEVEEKLDQQGLIKFIENVSELNSETEKILISKLESSVQGNTVFKDDIENPVYKRIVQVIREMKKPPVKSGK
jgi:hypothetical protein